MKTLNGFSAILVLDPRANPAEDEDDKADNGEDAGKPGTGVARRSAMAEPRVFLRNTRGDDEYRNSISGEENDVLPPHRNVALPHGPELAMARRTSPGVCRYLSLAIGTLYQRHICLLDKFDLSPWRCN